MLRLKVREVLRFFDEKPVDSWYNATALVSIIGEDLGTALLQRYLKANGESTSVVLSPNGHPITPKPGSLRGERLDRWLLSDVREEGKQVLYQVEIKNWSAHAVGGKPFPSGLPEAQVFEEYRRERWANQWNLKSDSFKHQTVAKVLKRMNIPLNDGRGNSIDVKTVEVKPIICFWDALHHEGKDESFFKVTLSSVSRDGFNNLSVFSMSNYLRSATEDEIDLEMPSATQRIQWLHRMFVLKGFEGSTNTK